MSALMKEQMNLLPDDCESQWQAVLAKDARFDGQFVFAVSSTGIYCRPSCPSRRPRRDRVSFFSLPEAAEQAGFTIVGEDKTDRWELHCRRGQ